MRTLVAARLAGEELIVRAEDMLRALGMSITRLHWRSSQCRRQVNAPQSPEVSTPACSRVKRLRPVHRFQALHHAQQGRPLRF